MSEVWESRDQRESEDAPGHQIHSLYMQQMQIGSWTRDKMNYCHKTFFLKVCYLVYAGKTLPRGREASSNLVLATQRFPTYLPLPWC